MAKHDDSERGEEEIMVRCLFDCWHSCAHAVANPANGPKRRVPCALPPTRFCSESSTPTPQSTVRSPQSRAARRAWPSHLRADLRLTAMSLPLYQCSGGLVPSFHRSSCCRVNLLPFQCQIPQNGVLLHVGVRPQALVLCREGQV